MTCYPFISFADFVVDSQPPSLARSSAKPAVSPRCLSPFPQSSSVCFLPTDWHCPNERQAVHLRGGQFTVNLHRTALCMKHSLAVLTHSNGALPHAWNKRGQIYEPVGCHGRDKSFCRSSSLLSICAANIISDMKVVIAMSRIGSFVPEMPTPLSSEERSFFIQSSDETFCSCGASLLYFASRSLPLCRACSLMLPFCPISAR